MYSPSKIIRPISLIALTLGCFGLSSQVRAICEEGCFTNSNTVLGDDALLNNLGYANPAIGNRALFSNTTGSFNTATGFNVLYSNNTGESNTAIAVTIWLWGLRLGQA